MFAHALATEFLTPRRSKETWLSLAGLSLGPAGIAIFMWIVREPGQAARLGLLGAKANRAGLTATWPAYSSTLTLIVGIGGWTPPPHPPSWSARPPCAANWTAPGFVDSRG